jgi:hypothetical protein
MAIILICRWTAFVHLPDLHPARADLFPSLLRIGASDRNAISGFWAMHPSLPRLLSSPARRPRLVTGHRIGAAVACIRSLLAGWLLFTIQAGLTAAEASPAGFAAARPVLTRYCIDCHSAESPEWQSMQ